MAARTSRQGPHKQIHKGRSQKLSLYPLPWEDAMRAAMAVKPMPKLRKRRKGTKK